MKRALISLLAALCVAAPLASRADEEPQTNLARVALTAGIHRIDAQVAQTTDQRMVGLRARGATLPPRDGTGPTSPTA